jgi:glutaminyl-tRNA synthetase
VLENYPEDQVEMLSASAHPNNDVFGMRELPFTRELYIERDDFLLDPPADFFRLAPGKEVRLRSAYVIKCERVITDPTTGEITEIRCTVDMDTLGKKPEGRKVKGVIHWVSAQNAMTAEVRLYDRLFTVENPGSEEDFTQTLNPHSLDIIANCYIEGSLAKAKPEQPFQFERLGYFVLDQKQSADHKLVFNRIVSLRDSWNN